MIKDQPEDASYEEILKELAFEQMIERSLEDSKEGRTISNEEMKRRFSAWQKTKKVDKGISTINQ